MGTRDLMMDDQAEAAILAVWAQHLRPGPAVAPPPDAHTLELRLLRAELAELRRLVEALRPQATDAAADFLAALAATYGAGTPFFAVDLVEFADAQPGLRADLRRALQRLCKTDTLPSPLQLGMALRQMASAPPAGFTVESVDRRGTTQWLIVDMRDRLPPAPQ